MSLLRRLGDRLRPWYALDAAAFLFGAVWFLGRGDSASDSVGSIAALADPFTLLVATVYGLLAIVAFRFTVGNLWAYAVEYVNAGGRWSDSAFLVPVGAGVLGAAATYATTTSVGAAVWAAFWAFVVAAGAVALAVSFAAGYREAES